jgi:hypothetical protein
LVVDLPLWKIWVRQLGRSNIVEKQAMFETTNQLGFKRQTLRMKWWYLKIGYPNRPHKEINSFPHVSMAINWSIPQTPPLQLGPRECQEAQSEMSTSIFKL